MAYGDGIAVCDICCADLRQGFYELRDGYIYLLSPLASSCVMYCTFFLEDVNWSYSSWVESVNKNLKIVCSIKRF